MSLDDLGSVEGDNVMTIHQKLDLLLDGGNSNSVYYLGTGTSFDIKTLLPDIDYESLKENNFIVCTVSGSATASCSTNSATQRNTSASFTPTKSYTNGVLSVAGLSNNGSDSGTKGSINVWGGINVSVYLVVGDIVSIA